MKETKYFYEYLNNENPFAFLKGYEKNKYMGEKVKKRLDSIQKMQPKFIPCTIDPGILSKEHNHAMNRIIKEGINCDINRGFEILVNHQVDFDREEYKPIGSGTNFPSEIELGFSDVGFDPHLKRPNYNLLRIDNILELFKANAHLEGMEDIIIEIYRLKLLNKQNIIRNKVFDAIKDKIDDEVVAGIDFDKPLDNLYLESIKRIIELESKAEGDK